LNRTGRWIDFHKTQGLFGKRTTVDRYSPWLKWIWSVGSKWDGLERFGRLGSAAMRQLGCAALAAQAGGAARWR